MAKDLLEIVEGAGIVGAGGAGFPTHVKLKAQAETVIINGAECEPLLRVDQELMAKRADELLEALSIIVEHVGAKEGIVALKSHYHKAVEALNKELPKYPKLKLHLMGSFYPAGDEQVMVYEATGRIVPEGGIPLHVGVVVTNVETALNVMDAVRGNTLTEKYVTITGEVKTPKTVKVPMGITVAQLLELAGGTTVSEYKVINGGPMMGRAIPVDSPITKTTKGLIVLPADHSLISSVEKPLEVSIKQAAVACMQCNMCTEVCPRGLLGHRLEPHKLMRIAGYGSMCDPKQTPMNAVLCCECRLCQYACVMDLQPWKLNIGLKKALRDNGINSTLKNSPEKVDNFRGYKMYPVKKLIKQLGLYKYDVAAPIEEVSYNYTVVNLPLRQNVGMAAEPIVKVGDKVEKGQLIATIPEGKLGANLHCTIEGIVLEISNDSIIVKS